MQKKRSIKIISVVMISVLICISITYFKNDSKVVLATTSEFNSENLQNNEHMHVEIDSSGDKVPVPNGYVGSKATGENEIDTGYVIYEGTEEVNDSNVEEAQKTRNQYVWIPVPDASKMYGTDANGKKWGKLYEFTTSTGNNIDPVTGAKPLNWSEENNVIKMTNKLSNREPDITINFGASSSELDSKIKNLDSNIKRAHDFLLQLEKEFNNMMDSVVKYGGFYIGRYETGDLNKDKPVIRKGNNNLGSQSWNTMYSKCKKLSNENVETGIIWGSQWDRTLMWLIETGCKGKKEIIEDSTKWGNYRNSTFEYVNNNGNIVTRTEGQYVIIPAGSSETTRANNIYDLAGNIREFSMEYCYGGKVGRGGCQAKYGDSTPSNHRNTEPMLSYFDLGCRAMLYIK